MQRDPMRYFVIPADEFQSSFSPRDECNASNVITGIIAQKFQSSFSPRDECNPDALIITFDFYEFQSSFSPRDECNCPLVLLRTRGYYVSILIQPKG